MLEPVVPNTPRMHALISGATYSGSCDFIEIVMAILLTLRIDPTRSVGSTSTPDDRNPVLFGRRADLR